MEAAILGLDSVSSSIYFAADASASDESPSDQEDVDERPQFADAADEAAYDMLMALPRVCHLCFRSRSSTVLACWPLCIDASALCFSKFALHLWNLCSQMPHIMCCVTSITYANALISP